MKIEDHSMYLKLRSVKKVTEFEELATEVLDRPSDIHPHISELIGEILKDSDYINPKLAIDFIIKTGDQALYADFRTSSQLRFNIDALIRLLKVPIPDEAIETRLTEILYERFQTKDWVYSIAILKALRDAGSINSLTLLKVLDYDFSAEFQVAKLKSRLQISAPGPLTLDDTYCFNAYADHVNNQVVKKVGKLIQEAISRVSSRNYGPEYRWFCDNVP